MPKLTNVRTFVIRTEPPHKGGATWFFVKLETDDGLEGWGETAVLGTLYGLESGAVATAVCIEFGVASGIGSATAAFVVDCLVPPPSPQLASSNPSTVMEIERQKLFNVDRILRTRNSQIVTRERTSITNLACRTHVTQVRVMLRERL